MAIGLIGTASNQTTGINATTPITQDVPAGVANGDFLLWVITSRFATAPATPTGWNLWLTDTTTGLGIGIFSRTASSEPASYTSGALASAQHASHMLAFSGVDTTTPRDVADPVRGKVTTALTFPAVTPVTAGAWPLGVGVVTSATNGATVTGRTSTNLTMDGGAASTSTSALNVGNGVGHFVWSTGAFTPDMTITMTTALARTIAASIVLRPAPVTAPTDYIGWGVPA